MPNDDAIIVGAGPNGLGAAIELAQAGLRVSVYEASDTVGGGARSAELTLPGYTHDLCSAVHPLAYASPFLRRLPLAQFGLEWINPDATLAHPFDADECVVLERSVSATSASLGVDRQAYSELFSSGLEHWSRLETAFLHPFHLLRRPASLARLSMDAFRTARGLVHRQFQGAKARALFLGLSAHSMLPLDRIPSAAFGLVLGLYGHAYGWPVPRGGAQKIADALAAYFRSLGGSIVTGRRVNSLIELPPARIVMCDVTPRQLLRIAGLRLPSGYRRSLERYRYGMGAFKVDWALSEPIPWRSRRCSEAITVHLGALPQEIEASERAAWAGGLCERPFVLLAQPSLFDRDRAPAGRHTAWAYCHVPHASEVDMLSRIENQVERFAPGFRDCILARSVKSPRDLERENPNLVGGDINGGVADWRQLLARPTWRLHRTPLKGLYLCSASTPPGGGVHGLCGYYAARAALHDLKK